MLNNFTYVVMDIETHVIGDNINPETDELRYVGFKNHLGKRVIFHYSEKEKIQKTINYFKYIVGHNIIAYDVVVLERYGFKFDYKKHVLIDTLSISQKRLKTMLYLDIDDKSLGNLAEIFKLQHKKGEMDYSILEKDKLEGEEFNQMEEYLIADLDTADDLFQHYYNMFYGFKELMSQKDKDRLCWLTSSSGTTAYKVVCHHAGLPEEYNDDADSAEKAYEGAFVSEPYIDFIE